MVAFPSVPVHPNSTRRRFVATSTVTAAAACAGLTTACRDNDDAKAFDVAPTASDSNADGAKTTGPTSPRTTTLDPLSDDPALAAALRLTYGLRPGLVEEIRSQGVTQWVEGQLAPATTTAEPPEVTERLAKLTTQSLPVADLVDRTTTTDLATVAQEAVLATIVRQVYSPAQLRELMVEFWTNHFAINLFEGPQRVLKPIDDREVIRRHALGRFEDLLAATAHSPAMLVSLDNAVSRAGAINENYGRELLELHTVGVDAGYGEADVVAAAKTLTGWTVQARQGQFRFAPALHDSASQTVMDWKTPTGAAGQGEAAGRDLLRYLAHHPATAKRLAAKLVTRFVGDSPDADLVAKLAKVYLDSDTEIPAVLRALFSDERFLKATPKFRRPHEVFVAMVRATGSEVDLGSVASAGVGRQRRNRRSLIQTLRSLGQLPMAWPSPDGYPDVSGAWLGPGALVSRWNLASDLVAGSFDGIAVDSDAVAGWAGGAKSAGELIENLATQFLGTPLPANSADAVASALKGSATDPATVKAAAALVLSSPRFQYR